MSETTARPPRDIIRAISPSVEFRDDRESGDKRPLLFGHFSRFNEWTEINSFFEGHFLERIVPGAYKKTFRERINDLRVLFQHGKDPVVGDKPIAEIEDLREDEQGAYHESRLLDGVPELIVSGLRAGQYGQSFRMEVMREEMVEKPERSEHNPEGLPERSIKEIRLHEFGPVTFPAYANTTPGLRSMTDEFVFGWLAREPERARELIGATDLSQAALRSADPEATTIITETVVVEATEQDPAPSLTDAAPERTSDVERRDPDTTGRYGLTQHSTRPSWAL